MTNLVKFASANLPTNPAALTSGLRNMAAEVGTSGGVAILKMDKTGEWVYGADGTEVEEGSQWAINPFSFIHGYIAWGDGDVLGEKMGPVSQPLPALDAAPAGAKKGWEMQVGMSLKCMNGEDEGQEVRYTTTSVGGKRAVQELGLAIAEQVEKNPATPVPVVVLKNDSYKHKQYGRIFTPIFEVVSWVGMDGEKAEAAPAEAEAPEVEGAEPPAAEAEAPRRRRRVVQ